MPPDSVIACIDDDVAVRQALEDLLDAYGFGVVTFASAEEFLDFAQMDRIWCLITDVKLDGMSGLQLQRRLNETDHQFPVIVVTAFGDEQLERQALEAGAIVFLRKPIGKDLLFAAIHKAIQPRTER